MSGLAPLATRTGDLWSGGDDAQDLSRSALACVPARARGYGHLLLDGGVGLPGFSDLPDDHGARGHRRWDQEHRPHLQSMDRGVPQGGAWRDPDPDQVPPGCRRCAEALLRRFADLDRSEHPRCDPQDGDRLALLVALPPILLVLVP